MTKSDTASSRPLSFRVSKMTNASDSSPTSIKIRLVRAERNSSKSSRRSSAVRPSSSHSLRFFRMRLLACSSKRFELERHLRSASDRTFLSNTRSWYILSLFSLSASLGSTTPVRLSSEPRKSRKTPVDRLSSPRAFHSSDMAEKIIEIRVRRCCPSTISRLLSSADGASTTAPRKYSPWLLNAADVKSSHSVSTSSRAQAKSR